jgi:3-deoxy-7-phosphoheptulonate synthase
LILGWRRTLVSAVARSRGVIGSDGLIVEAHPSPERAISDGAQSLDLNQFARMMDDLKPYIALWEETRKKETVAAVAR